MTSTLESLGAHATHHDGETTDPIIEEALRRVRQGGRR